MTPARLDDQARAELKSFAEHAVMLLSGCAIPVRHETRENDHGPLDLFVIEAPRGTAGRIIGKQGRTIEALRVVLQAMAGRYCAAVNICASDREPKGDRT